MSFSFYTISNEWDERNARTWSVLHARFLAHYIIYIYIFFLRIHRHSKNGDENSGPVEGRGTRIRARALSRGRTIVLVTIFTFHTSTDIALLFKPPLRRRLVNTLDIHLTLSLSNNIKNKQKHLLCCSPISCVRRGTAETVRSIFHAPRMTCMTNKCWERLLNLAMEDGGWGSYQTRLLYLINS